MRTIAENLQFPEGPLVLPDGTLVLVEIRRQTLTHVDRNGRQRVIAKLGGGPNGAALGPDGAVYVCNNGGFRWRDHEGLSIPGVQADDYSGGRIERVDLDSGRAEVLYDRVGEHGLRGPNDIVFDAHGGFWFTDLGKHRHRDMDNGGIYYAKADGSSITEVVYPMNRPNGIGLSPDGKTLYVAETQNARVWAWDVTGPGALAREPFPSPNGARLIHTPDSFRMFDSLAVEANGNVCVATLMEGGISVCAPEGGLVEFVPFDDPFTTNICFGGDDMQTAYITLSGTGRLVAVDWPRPGLVLNA
ncbi:MAG: SMP-30/gluconolactonase/LRE family protein [Burkholderiaceae bacterium]|nr:SMP-30/gluconolactonase/LRE family protein [Burkholderiaceae bacterium]